MKKIIKKMFPNITKTLSKNKEFTKGYVLGVLAGTSYAVVVWLVLYL